jgi:hypothetical protein
MNILTIRVLAVKVRQVPARKAALVQLHNVIDLDPTGTAFGYLAQPLVQQPLQSICYVRRSLGSVTPLRPSFI